jgi:hypothetical protein
MCAWQFAKEQERLIMVATPSKGWVSDKFHARFCAMQPPLRLIHNMISGKPIDLARNVMVTKALQEKCEFIFFLDSDILVNPDTLVKLFVANMPIISAVYYSRAPPYEMVAQVKGQGLSHEMAGKDEVREVEEVGMGCCLVNCRVFHRVGKKLDWQCLMPHSEGEKSYLSIYSTRIADQILTGWKYSWRLNRGVGGGCGGGIAIDSLVFSPITVFVVVAAALDDEEAVIV